MKSPLISVIIPVYNVEPYLTRCVESVINQTYKNLEIILVDDGSTDNSGSICDNFIDKDNRIRVFHQVNQGLSSARNKGLDESNGEWIAFLDSDDWIDLDMYETLLHIALQHNADISTCGTKYVVDGIPSMDDKYNDSSVTVFNSEEMIKGLLDQKYVRYEVWNKLWKRELIDELRFVVGQVCEDVYFDRKLFIKANKMVYINRQMHNYLVSRPGNTNSSFKIKRLCIFDEFDNLLKEEIIQKDKELIEIVNCMAVRFSVLFYEEAVIANQSAEVLDNLQSVFTAHYSASNFSAHNTRSASTKMRIFNISPRLFIVVRKLQRRL